MLCRAVVAIACLVGLVVALAAPSGGAGVAAGADRAAATGFRADEAVVLATGLDGAHDVAVAADGTTYVASAGVVRRVRDGVVSTVAGGGSTAPYDGVEATTAHLSTPEVAVGPDGTLHLTDDLSVYALAPDGTLRRVARVVQATEPGTLPPILSLYDVHVDAAGRVLVVVSDGTVRRTSAAGSLEVIAGGGAGVAAPHGDGAAAVGAWLSPVAVTTAAGGEVYVLGRLGLWDGRVVWRVDSGTLVRVLGNPATLYTQCPEATQIEFQDMGAIATDGLGRLHASTLGGLVRLRGDGRVQRLRGATDSLSPIAGLGVDGLDRTYTVVDGVLRRAPAEADAADACRGFPYATPRAAVDALADRFRVRLSPTERLFLADDVAGGRIPVAALADQYLHGPGWGGRVGPVLRLYLASLGRPADTGGLSYWLDQRERGRSLVSLAAYFVRSTEFRTTYGSLDDRAFVDRVYRNVLGRSADAAGAAYWVGRMRGGTTRAEVVLGFSESPEMRSRSAALTEATLVTFGLLDRVPTAAEVARWRSRLAVAPSGHLVALTWYSAEHRRLVTGAG